MKSPTDLFHLQVDFRNFVLTGRPGVEDWIASSDTASAAERLAVYANAYRLRLLEVLGNDFPALKAFLGEHEFERIGRDYIAAHPSDTPSVRWFGRHLPGFLHTAAADRPVVSELARFEWLRGEVFDAAEAERVRLEQIAAIPPDHWPGLRLSLHPALRRLRLHWNAPAIGKALLAQAEAPPPQFSPAEWLLWRKDLDVYWRSLDETEAVALDGVAAGASFAEVCEALLPRVGAEHAALHAASLLKRWVTDGLLAPLREADGDEGRGR